MKLNFQFLAVHLLFLLAEGKSLRSSLPTTPESDESRELVEYEEKTLKYGNPTVLQNDVFDRFKLTRYLSGFSESRKVLTLDSDRPDAWIFSGLSKAKGQCVKYDDVVTASLQKTDCFSIDPITLKPDLSTGDNLNRNYTPVDKLPIPTPSGVICKLKLETFCKSGDFTSAPFCSWKIALEFNKGGTTCDDPKALLIGTINASGTGPAAYDVNGGDFDFAGAFGQLDSVFNIKTLELNDFQTVGEVCYNAKLGEAKFLSAGPGDEKLFTSNGEIREQSEFIIRSDSGTGSRSFPDPRQGRCVEVNDKIQLQANYADSRWVSGSRFGGNSIVLNRDKFDPSYNRYETNALSHYLWIVKDEGKSD